MDLFTLMRLRFIGTTALCREGEGTGSGTGTGTGTGTPTVVAPWGSDPAKPWMLGEATNAKPWYEAALPDGPTKEFVRTKNFANPHVMADALFSANRMANGNAIEIPNIGEPNTPYDPKPWEGFNAKLRGESIKAPTDYKFNFGKDAEGKDIAPDAGLLKLAQEISFESGLHPKRAQEIIVNRWQAYAKEANAKAAKEATAANEAEANSVRQKWGENFETLRAGGERVAKALKLAPETLSKIEAHIGAAPLMDLFAQLGQLSAEGKLVSGEGSGTTDPISMTADQIQQKINDRKSDTQFMAAFNDKMHANHKSAVAEIENLYKLLAQKNKPA